jgi:hypothetical protein
MYARPFFSRGARAALARRVLYASLAALSACGSPPVHKPPAPDMQALIDSYDNPTASVGPDDASDVALAVVAVDALLQQTALRQQLVDVLSQVLDQAVELSDGNNASGFTIDADGYMLITRICSGWTEPGTPDRAANGALLVTATFSDSGLDPIVWGSAAACRYLVSGTQVELDQSGESADSVSVYWGESVEEQELAERALLVDLNLDASIDGQRLSLDFDFRSLAGGDIEYRIERPDGSLIGSVGGDDSVTLRAANGTFACDADLQCEPVAGGS